MPIPMPTYTQLSGEQKLILEDSEFDENILVIGPPGTGKTVIAMHRAEQLARARRQDVNLIMYNKVLEHYTSQWESKVFQSSVKVRTYHSWVWALWRQSRLPGQPPKLPDDAWKFDWSKIQAELLRHGVILGQVVIDEAQDLPVAFYRALGMLAGNTNGETSFCIVADENQRLEESHNSSINDIRTSIALAGVPQQYLLEQNYRNTFEIAALASKFYVGLQTGTAELPTSRRGQKPRMIGYGAGTNGMVDAIGRYAANNPTHSILVVCPSKPRVKSLRNKIAHRLPKRKVNAYVSNDKAHAANLLETGLVGSITVLHWRSMKGVESDVVFVPHVEQFDFGGDSTTVEKMRLYVLFSRARHMLEIQYDQTDNTASGSRLVSTIRDLSGDLLEESIA